MTKENNLIYHFEIKSKFRSIRHSIKKALKEGRIEKHYDSFFDRFFKEAKYNTAEIETYLNKEVTLDDLTEQGNSRLIKQITKSKVTPDRINKSGTKFYKINTLEDAYCNTIDTRRDYLARAGCVLMAAGFLSWINYAGQVNVIEKVEFQRSYEKCRNSFEYTKKAREVIEKGHKRIKRMSQIFRKDNSDTSTYKKGE